MYIDKQSQFSSAQAITTSAASTNVVDLGPVGPNGYSVDGDEPLQVLITVDETVTADGAATVTFQLRTASAATMSSPVILLQSDAIAKATLIAGARVAFRPTVPAGALRYLDLYYAVGTGPLTAGKFSAAIVANRQTAS
jgi:hypothetical protein